MQRKTWIAVIVLIGAALLFFFFYAAGEDDLEEVVFEAVTGVSRVEIVPAAEEEVELMVFERRDGQWWMTRPVEGVARQQRLEGVVTSFARPVRTDDIRIDPADAEKYLLDGEQAVRLSLFRTGDVRPRLELWVGREFEVIQTGAYRTFIRRPGDETIYRAHGAFGAVVRGNLGRFLETQPQQEE